ncbi:unnamed protein product [Ceratitis capitata]|uniref:(Mediterranean fruit fly) hypothetical protein n=1 Tax=Ceratitis capitata TaxID=7213 RepID=A0A811VJE3_CERCA|nr:unnamed protein product [Ceratitis capitata]
MEEEYSNVDGIGICNGTGKGNGNGNRTDTDTVSFNISENGTGNGNENYFENYSIRDNDNDNYDKYFSNVVRVSECKENDLSWDGGKGTRNGNDKYNSKRTGNGKGNNIGSYFRLDKDDNYGNGMVIGI